MMYKIWTIEELAKDAFDKAERVKCLEMMNTPADYDARKQAFVDLALARASARDAEERLTNVVNKGPQYGEAVPKEGPQPQ